MKIFRFGTVITLIASLSATSLFAGIFTLDTCLEETFSPYEFSAIGLEETSGQINPETEKYCCNEESDIDNEITDKTTYINNCEYFHTQDFSPSINDNPPEVALLDSSSKINNITKLLYLLNSSFMI